MLVHRFVLLIILVSIFIFTGCEKAPKIENATLVEHAFEDFKVYHFQFAFTNPLDQPITIKSVEVLDKDGNKIDHSPSFYSFIKQANFRIELLTHETVLEGYETNPYDLKHSPFSFANGTPLEKAILISHKQHVKGKMVFGDKTNQDMKVTLKTVERVMKEKETLNPARYLLFIQDPHETLQLKVNYEEVKGVRHVLAKFETQKK